MIPNIHKLEGKTGVLLCKPRPIKYIQRSYEWVRVTCERCKALRPKRPVKR